MTESTLKKREIILFAASLFVGILFDLLFFGKFMGVSYPIFIIAFYFVFIICLRDRLAFRVDLGWTLLLPIILLSATYLLYSNNIFRFFNFLAVPLLVIIQTIIVTKSNKYDWFKPGFILDILNRVFNYTLVNLPIPFSFVKNLIKSNTDENKYKVFKKIVLGLLISAPLLLIVIALLASADKVFQHFLGEIPRMLEYVNIGEFIARTFLVLLVALFMFAFTWSFIEPEKEKAEAVPETENIVSEAITPAPIKITWDPVIVMTVLFSINIVYILFTLIQFSYFFGGGSFTLPTDFTYAEYARKGFFELLFVTVINFSIMLGIINFVNKDSKALYSITRVLLCLLIVCTLVMLFSAFMRLSMYEEAYGYTYLRVLSHAFMIFLFVLFIVAFYKIWQEKVSLVKPYIIVSLAAYLIINFVNIDGIIARNNIDRFIKTGEIDVGYLSYLSYDAVPELVRLLEYKEDKYVYGTIQNNLYLRKEALAQEKPWQSFNISDYRASQILSQYELSMQKVDGKPDTRSRSDIYRRR